MALDSMIRGITVQDIENLDTKFKMIKPIDINGADMHDMVKFLKRGSALFSFRVGRAS